jgi:hypothetical protein
MFKVLGRCAVREELVASLVKTFGGLREADSSEGKFGRLIMRMLGFPVTGGLPRGGPPVVLCGVGYGLHHGSCNHL